MLLLLYQFNINDLLLSSDPKRQFELNQLRTTFMNWHTHLAHDNGIDSFFLHSNILSLYLFIIYLYFTKISTVSYRKHRTQSGTCSPLERWHAQLYDMVNTSNSLNNVNRGMVNNNIFFLFHFLTFSSKLGKCTTNVPREVTDVIEVLIDKALQHGIYLEIENFGLLD
jgi:hypothetical protein